MRQHRINRRIHQMQTRLESMEKSINIPGHRQRVAGRELRDEEKFSFLRQTGDDQADAVFKALADPDPLVRTMALKSLGQHPGKRVVLLILDALHDPMPMVRSAAVSAAARARISAAVFTLILLLDDTEPEVVQETQWAIEKITGQRLDFDPFGNLIERANKIEDLKLWWKEQRFSHLAREFEAAEKT